VSRLTCDNWLSLYGATNAVPDKSSGTCRRLLTLMTRVGPWEARAGDIASLVEQIFGDLQPPALRQTAPSKAALGTTVTT